LLWVIRRQIREKLRPSTMWSSTSFIFNLNLALWRWTGQGNVEQFLHF
jgi:hypothetical protein